MRAKDVPPTLDDMPPELRSFRLDDWHHLDDAQKAAADPEAHDPADRAAVLVSLAYERYKAARREWAKANGVSTLDEMLDRRRHRVAEWLVAERQAERSP